MHIECGWVANLNCGKDEFVKLIALACLSRVSLIYRCFGEVCRLTLTLNGERQWPLKNVASSGWTKIYNFLLNRKGDDHLLACLKLEL